MKADLGIIGKKWTMLILADIGFRKISRFSELLHSNLPITSRMVSRRLNELERTGIIFQQERMTAHPQRKRPSQQWKLTAKGRDLLPAIIHLIAFSAKWNVDESFRGHLPKRLS